MNAFYRRALREQSRLARLARLHFLAKASEIDADPCTPERATRARRADRILAAYFAEKRRAVSWEVAA